MRINMTIDSKIKAAIEKAIKEYGSQYELAKRAGITQPSIARYRNGDIGHVSDDLWQKLYPHISKFMVEGIGEKLDDIMDKFNISPKQLADKTGIPALTIVAYRSGKEIPPDSHIARLARALGVGPEALSPDKAGHIFEAALALDEQLLIDKYRSLNDAMKKKAINEIIMMKQND